MKKKYLLAVSLGGVVLLTIGLVTVVMLRLGNAKDCTSAEKYDLVRDECYFECGSDQECEALSKKVDEELNKAFSGSKVLLAPQKSAPVTPSPSPAPAPIPAQPVGGLYTNDSTGSETGGTTYTVQPDGSLQPSPRASHGDMWNLFVKIVGKERAVARIVSFEVFNDANNGNAASVWRTQHDGGKWHMNVNEAFRDDHANFVHTLVHEFGHTLTLSSDQVSEVSGACPRLMLAEGCANEPSYAQKFWQAFWSKYRGAPDGNNDNGDVAQVFYESRPDAFVSAYAATNLTEDMAESWAYFVLRPQPTGHSEKDQKVSFFYQFPELVSLRNSMRATVGNDVLHRNKKI